MTRRQTWKREMRGMDYRNRGGSKEGMTSRRISAVVRKRIVIRLIMERVIARRRMMMKKIGRRTID